ncbi:MAG: M55 family metallopeptidase [Anaerolineaceae bacterium]|nr:M55 family metallopeptidase [Anaerolineaceae bacterium]
MKVYISADMEGVAGVTQRMHVNKKLGGSEYEMARRWMTAEVNAAVEGAIKAGAEEIVVADSHGGMTNLLPQELHKDITLVQGRPRPLHMMHGVDESFDAVFLIAYHAMAGTPRGVLAHNFQADSIRLNGVTVGETGFNSAIAGHFGVPVVLVSGDDTLAAEVKSIIPSAERVTVKTGISRFAAHSLTPEMSQGGIRAGAERALGRLVEMKSFIVDTPVQFEMDFPPSHPALFLGVDIDGVELVGFQTLTYRAKDMLDVVRVMRMIFNMSSGDPASRAFT